MAEFRDRFLARAHGDAESIGSALARGDLGAIRSLCHGLSGNAGMFGFADVGTLAQAVEEAVDRGADADEVRGLTAPLLERIAQLDQER